MDKIEELQKKIQEILPEVDDRMPEPDSFEEFKESRRRANAEPRCKNYRAAELEPGLGESASGTLKERIDSEWEKAYIDYLEEKLETLKYAKEHPLEVGAVFTWIDQGARNLVSGLPFEDFEGESKDFNTSK